MPKFKKNTGYTPFKMKGHTLPGINQRSEGNTDLPDGRSGSSPFQANYKKSSPTKWVQAVAALAPVAMELIGKMKKKKEEE
tara:strand:- start:666 stop:908 length:243 start_codon:yes stop_codon:yes gene_type:complete